MFLNSAEAWQLLFICAGVVAGFLLCAYLINLKKNIPLFYSWIGAIAIFGGALAFLLPIALNSGFGKDDDGRVLRQLILYTTGGVLGVITLGESHRKNSQEKEKNENDHTRQVHAERRSRYTKAVEQLADEKAAVRLGGIYTLVGLVDEWLADDTLDPEEQQKEGQVIINSLCSYIRSPFPLALKAEVLESDIEPTDYEGDFAKDQAVFREEQDVRRSIFVEMSKRSSEAILDDDGKLIEIIPGTWNNFDVNFSRAPVFYPLNTLTIEKADFSGAKFYTDAKFFESSFIGTANFNETVFTNNADFSATAFTDTLHFNEAIFAKAAEFNGAIFTGNAFFAGTTFTSNADFRSSVFTQSRPIFAMAISNIGLWRARFSAHADPKDYIFETYPKSTHNFACGTAELLSRTFVLPLHAVLYDPDSWDEEKQDYTRFSEPAK